MWTTCLAFRFVPQSIGAVFRAQFDAACQSVAVDCADFGAQVGAATLEVGIQPEALKYAVLGVQVGAEMLAVAAQAEEVVCADIGG